MLLHLAILEVLNKLREQFTRNISSLESEVAAWLQTSALRQSPDLLAKQCNMPSTGHAETSGKEEDENKKRANPTFEGTSGHSMVDIRYDRPSPPHARRLQKWKDCGF